MGETEHGNGLTVRVIVEFEVPLESEAELAQIDCRFRTRFANAAEEGLTNRGWEAKWRHVKVRRLIVDEAVSERGVTNEQGLG